MVVARVHLAAPKAPRPTDVKPIRGNSSMSPPMRRNPSASAEIRSLSLPAAPAPRDAQLAPVRGQRPQHRQFVDDSWHSAGAISVEPKWPCRTDRAAIADLKRSALDLNIGPHPSQHIDDAGSSGVHPHGSYNDLGPESDAAATIQNAADEMSPGTSRFCARKALAPFTDTERSRASPAHRTPAAPAPYDPEWPGSWTVVTPLACRPASNTAVLTCALGLG